MWKIGVDVAQIASAGKGPNLEECMRQYNKFRKSLVLVVMDCFTNWPEVYAIPNQEASTVAEVLVDNFFCRFGVQRELHSDQGRNFEPAVFREVCDRLGI